MNAVDVFNMQVMT